jgi:hypothetical protein
MATGLKAELRRQMSAHLAGTPDVRRRPDPWRARSARALASRQNGARSRGPKSATGNARAAHNALRHGLRARRMVLLDDEHPAEPQL